MQKKTKMSENPLLEIDTPNLYRPIQKDAYPRLETVEDFLAQKDNYDAYQYKELTLEAEMFGINPDTNPEGFIAAHSLLLNEAQHELTERLPALKKDLINKVAAHFFQEDDPRNGQLRDTLTNRLDATNQVIISDRLTSGKHKSNKFSPGSRQITMASHELVNLMDEKDNIASLYDTTDKVIVAHELLHGASTHGRQEVEPGVHIVTRAGLAVSQVIEVEDGKSKRFSQGKWLNEATIETLRQKVMETDQVRYEPGVMVLHMLEEFSPGIEDELALAAIASKGPGEVYGKIEALLGPGSIEDIGTMLLHIKGFAELEKFKDYIAARLPINLQDKGRALLNDKEAQVFSWSPHYIVMKAEHLAANQLAA